MKPVDYQKCGKYLSYLFWLLIPNFIAGILTNERVGGQVRALFIIGTVINVLCMIAYAYFLWQMQTEEPLYKNAALFSLAAAVWALIDEFFINTKNAFVTVVFSLIGLVITVMQIYFVYEAHSYVVYDLDQELSGKWIKLRKRYFIGVALTAIGVIIVWTAPNLGLLCALAGGIVIIVVSITELVYLYRSAQLCKNQQYEL